jgi:transaldolase
LIGGDVVISPPHKWQVRFNASNVEVIPRIDKPVDPKVVNELLLRFPDFQRAYTENGLSINDFDAFAATRRTLRQFIAACHDFPGIIRDRMLPSPDQK